MEVRKDGKKLKGYSGTYSIPEGATSNGFHAFYECSGLTTVNYTGTEEEWNTLITASPNANIPAGAIVVYNYVSPETP